MIPAQLHQAASALADSKALAIVEAAQARLNKVRWQRLRRGLTSPQTDRERAYMEALGQYVFRKMYIRQQEKSLGYCPNRSRWEAEMADYRVQMDRLEYNLRVRSLS